MKRRTFLVAGAAAVTAGVLPGCKPKKTVDAKADDSAPAKPPKPYEYKFFNPGELVTLFAILARLLPEHDPSGAPSYLAANVAPFIDAQLELPDFRALERMMRGGLEFVQTVSTRRFGGPFETRPVEVQDELLGQFQTGTVRGLEFPQQRWFATLHAFALEGYWGDPKYGGNHGEQVWKWAQINPHCAHIHLECGG